MEGRYSVPALLSSSVTVGFGGVLGAASEEEGASLEA